MPKGLALPVTVNGSGGAALLDGVAQDDKIVRMGLADNSSNNAFQQGIGFGLFPVFDVDSPETRITIGQRVREIFQSFQAQERFKLREETLEFSLGEPGELILAFKYLNLRADQERTFSSTITPNGITPRL